MPTQIFVNLPVKDIVKTRAFWTALGFSFNPQFSDENAASLVIDEGVYAMLMTHAAFEKFTKKKIVDANKMTEVINALQFESRDKVDELVDKAIAAGATEYLPDDNHEWMYLRRFADLDGHQWEICFMDMSKFPAKK